MELRVKDRATPSRCWCQSIVALGVKRFDALGELDRVFRSPVEPIGLEDIGAILIVKPKHFARLEVSGVGVNNPHRCGGKRMPDDVEAVHPASLPEAARSFDEELLGSWIRTKKHYP
jgi:hypothetical protein